MSNLCRIKLSQIDFDDKRYCFSYPSQSDSLKRFIEKSGVISPLIVKEKGGKYSLVSGFRRFRAVADLGVDSVPVQVTDKDDFECFETAVLDNLSTRKLNLFEVSDILSKLSKVFKIQIDRILTDYMPLFGYNSYKKTLDRLISLTELSEKQKEVLFKNNIESEKILLLPDLDIVVLDNMIGLLVDLKPGLNKFKQIIELFLEISQREGLRCSDLFKDKEVDSILSDKIRTSSQKLNHLRTYLSARRFPTVSKKESEFGKKLAKLNIRNDIRLTPPPSFEGKFFDLSFRFKNRQELKEYVRQLSTLSENEGLDEVIDFCNL